MALISDRRGSEWWVWDVDTLDWIKGTPSTATGGPASNVTVDNFPATQAVSDGGSSLTVDGPVTDTQLRAADVKVTLDGEIPHVIIDSMPAGGSGLTDSELRAADVKVTLDSEQVAISNFPSSQTVSGTVAVSNSTFPVTDNAGSLTVDAPVTTPVFVRLSDGSSAIATLPVSLASVPSHAVTNAGTFAVQGTEVRPATSTLSNVASSASNVTLLASNANRKGGYLFNDSTQDCYVKLGTTASSSSFTVKMSAGAFYELPFPCYTGIIDGIWASANGNMRVTEITN